MFLSSKRCSCSGWETCRQTGPFPQLAEAGLMVFLAIVSLVEPKPLQEKMKNSLMVYSRHRKNKTIIKKKKKKKRLKTENCRGGKSSFQEPKIPRNKSGIVSPAPKSATLLSFNLVKAGENLRIYFLSKTHRSELTYN